MKTPLATRAALAAAALALSACAALPSPPQRPQAYDLGRPLPAAAPASAASSPQALLAIDPIQSSANLDGNAFTYRLLYAEGDQNPRPYANARWTMSPPELLTQRMRQSFAAVRPIAESDSGLARYVLRAELEEFAHIFDSPQQSAGVVQLRVSLLAPNASGQRLLGQRSFSVRQNAPTPDAAGGAQALRQASDELLRQVRDWAHSLAP